jgi:hypothetical protein
MILILNICSANKIYLLNLNAFKINNPALSPSPVKRKGLPGKIPFLIGLPYIKNKYHTIIFV